MKLLFIILPFLFISCGKETVPWQTQIQVQSLTPAEPVDYTYELETKSCSTGKHQYDTLIEICEALKNNKLNNNCALEERENLFVSSCPGDFKSS